MIYKYIDYRKFLNESITSRKRLTPHITFAKIAEEIQIQRSYLSQVLSGKYNLNSDQLFLIGKKLGLDDKEIEYLLILLEIEKTQVKERKRKLESLRDSFRNQFLKSETFMEKDSLKIDDGLYSRYYTDPYCSLVHMYLVIPKFRKDPNLINEKIQISREKLADILQILEKCKIIEISKGSIKILKETIHLNEGSFLSKTNATMFRLKAIESQMRSKIDSDYFFTASISANASSKIAIKQKFLEFLKEISPLVASAPAEEIFHLNFDLFDT